MKKETKKKFVDPRYAKTVSYSRDMAEIAKANVCPLCILKWHTNPILKTEGGWFITKTTQPYENTDLHFLIISKKHKEHMRDMKSADWKAIDTLIKWAIKKFKIPGGGIAMRFGETAYTGATICHLHAHLIMPKLSRGKAIPVYFPFG